MFNHSPNNDRPTPSSRRRLPRVALGALALVVLLAPRADAQTRILAGFQERHDRVEREIERTSELWKTVSGRAAQSNVPGARALVEQARNVQERALDALRAARERQFQAGSPDAEDRIASRHLQSSLSLTLRARDLTTRAQRQLREDLSQEENARRTIERARQRFESIEGDADVRLRSQARQLIDRAELQWRDGSFEQALRLAQNAVSVLEAIDERDGETPDARRVADALRRTRERFERAVDAGANSGRLQAIDRLLDQAERALRDDRPRDAAQRVVAARRALDDLDSRDGGGDSRTERALERLDAQIERIQERFGSSLDATGQRLLRQAGEVRDRARRALRNGDEERAQQQIRAAADLLARLQRHADGR